MRITTSRGEQVSEEIFEGSKRILLIEPPFYNLFGYQRWHYPITLTLVGSFLKEMGHEVRICDADKPLPSCKSYSRTQARDNYYQYALALENDNHPSWKQIREEMINFNPDIIGLTSVTAKIDSADKISEDIRKIFGKKVKVILGGPHAQGMRDSNPVHDFGNNYDFIVTFIPGLINRRPDKSLLLSNGAYSRKELSTILTSTGCPYSCTYCCNSLFDKKVQFKDLRFVEEELREIKESGEKVIVADDSFFSYTRRFHEIGRLFNDLGLNFDCDARINDLQPQKIEEFMKNGGKKLSVGIESGSQRVLDRIKKKITIEQILSGSKLLNNFNIPWTAFFMVGFPFETLDDLKITEEIIYKTQPTFASINKFTPYPGTDLWKEYYSDSRLRFRDLFQLTDKNVTMLSDEMIEYIDSMLLRFDKYNSEKAK